VGGMEWLLLALAVGIGAAGVGLIVTVVLDVRGARRRRRGR